MLDVGVDAVGPIAVDAQEAGRGAMVYDNVHEVIALDAPPPVREVIVYERPRPVYVEPVPVYRPYYYRPRYY